MLAAFLLAVEETPTPQTSAPWWSNVMLFLPILVLFYLIVFAPGRRQEKQRQAMLVTLKKNDKIVNSGGIIGIVESVKDKENEVVLRGGLRVTKASIVQVVREDAAKDQKEGGA
jgi:preprotein translocase subunit YajC